MKQIILFCLLVSASHSLLALGLGNMQVASRVNQQFSATIPVSVSDETDVTEITVRLADYELFKKANIQRSGVLSQLKFTLQRNAEGQMEIQISSSETVKEPMLSFILYVEYKDSKTLREYTALLEIPTR